MIKYAILVTNTWTKKQSLMPGIYTVDDAKKKQKEFIDKCSCTGSIKNNSYDVITIRY